MDIDSWKKLTDEEKEEFKQLIPYFIQWVHNCNVADGFDFALKYEVRQVDEYYAIYDKSTNDKFGYFESLNKNVIQALMTDAVQNYGR